MTTRIPSFILLCSVAVILAAACTGNVGTTNFINSQFNFSFVDKVAVLELENLSSDQQAAARTTRILITELLASGAMDVVEPGEVQAAVERILKGNNTPTTENIIELGQALGVQAIFVGSVTQSEVIRYGAVSTPVVTLDLHMLETETGKPVWAATHTEKGSGASEKWLGTGGEPISKTTRKCVQNVLKSLLQ